MKQALEEHGTPNEFKLLRDKYSYFDDMLKQLLSDKRKSQYDPLDLADAQRIAFKLLWVKEFAHKDYRHFPEIMKEDRIKQNFLDVAKINEDTGEEYDAESTYEAFTRACSRVKDVKDSYKPQRLLIKIKDGVEQLNEILDSNALLKKPNCIRLINEILGLTKNLEDFRDKNDGEIQQ